MIWILKKVVKETISTTFILLLYDIVMHLTGEKKSFCFLWKRFYSLLETACPGTYTGVLIRTQRGFFVW